MSDIQRELHLGLMFWANGTHPCGWRMPNAHHVAPFDIAFLQNVTRIVEDSAFDFLFLGDRLASDPALQRTNPSQMCRLEPFVAAASLAAATSRIGIVVTANPTYYDPINLAQMTASLDHLSRGRASWNLVTGADEAAAGNFSRDHHWDVTSRYDRADEFVAVVRALWRSWPDSEPGHIGDQVSAFRGVATTPISHRGKVFSIDGELDLRSPPQGDVVILHAGTSDRSRELGARDADVIFAGYGNFDEARAYYADIKTRAGRYGRAPNSISILPGLTPIVAPTTQEAVAIYDQLNSYINLDPEAGTDPGPRAVALGGGGRLNLAYASQVIGVDITGAKPDAFVDPLVLVEANAVGQSIFATLTRLTRRDVTGGQRLTYRDVILACARGGSGAIVVGNPDEVSDHIQTWFENGAADGFNIFPAYNPDSVISFTSLVVPELRRRGLFRTEYAGQTFRNHLGLEA
nr:LLM class flavin-dependent oxidoreductase [Acetobacter persici]